ncbi:hypothetical protein [Actinacidiphila oryziradicis]|uniref:Uncharacterized protein n=1 Tax=Actinacidiphila oryziradicis TaxID=2571141 RepID=A0A4U0SFL9_9ACTN|nr:hypothetical protein [Actinacidiphila oryziradicis]TKA06561.1 hypothetical protein FCI23_31310 [Actinacidiphila oryziradicis]
MDASALPADHPAIMEIVTATAEPLPAKDVSMKLDRGTGPGQVEPVRDKLRRLADRGWLHRIPPDASPPCPHRPPDRTWPDFDVHVCPGWGFHAKEHQPRRRP